MSNQKITIPDALMKIKYNGRIIPNGKERDMFLTGANCQVFAYHLLRLQGLVVPDYRSSELWEDVEFSIKVTDNYQPLDILFFNKTPKAYGAHLAVYVGNHQAIHLAKKIGKPVVWELSTFFKQPKYAVLLGGKRFFQRKL